MKKHIIAPSKKSHIIASSKLDEFMKYHEDNHNYAANPEGFDRMYSILDKYGDDNDGVDKPFLRATPEDQQRMIDLINPNKIPLGVKGHAKQLYREALKQNNAYSAGVLDAFNSLFQEYFLDEDDFQ